MGWEFTPARERTARENLRVAHEVYWAGTEDRTRELVEDAEWILASASPDVAARKLGYDNPGSLAQRLHRAGRDDLARPFWQAARKTTAA